MFKSNIHYYFKFISSLQKNIFFGSVSRKVHLSLTNGAVLVHKKLINFIFHWQWITLSVRNCQWLQTWQFLGHMYCLSEKNGRFIVRSMENALRHHNTIHSSSMTQFTTYQVICNITVLHMHSYYLKQSLDVSSRTAFRRYLLAIDNHLLSTQTHFTPFWYC